MNKSLKNKIHIWNYIKLSRSLLESSQNIHQVYKMNPSKETFSELI
jgi:hypothetical protein